MKKDFLNKLITGVGIILGSSSLYAGDMGPANTAHNWTGL